MPTGFKPRWWWFFCVQHYVEDVFLAVVEVVLMSQMKWNTAITVATIGLYVVAVMWLRPFDSGLDLVLNVAEYSQTAKNEKS